MKFDICLNKKKYVVEIQGDNAKVLSKTPFEEKLDDDDLDLPDFDFAEEDQNSTLITAALPGTVLSVAVKEGQEVRKGQTLLVLESMKMENAITAPIDGVVGDVAVSVGSYVTKDQRLATIKALEG